MNKLNKNVFITYYYVDFQAPDDEKVSDYPNVSILKVTTLVKEKSGAGIFKEPYTFKTYKQAKKFLLSLLKKQQKRLADKLKQISVSQDYDRHMYIDDSYSDNSIFDVDSHGF